MPEKPRSASVVDLPDDVEEVNDYFHSHRYTDGLPIIPPTEERVRRFVEYTKRDALEIIGEVPPLWAHATVEKIAGNAVMAGCKAEYMPVLIAAIQAICPPPGTRPGAAEEDPINLHGSQTTTNSLGPIFFVNGPIRNELEINCGAHVMGPGFRANMTIGRAIRLMLINVGGALPGDVSKSTFSWPGRTSLVIGEYEEESPWEPMHVERGFKPEDSVITAVQATGNELISNTSEKPESLLYTLVKGNVIKGSGEVTLIVPPNHARLVSSLGYTKEALKKHIFENARIPLEYAKVSLERYQGLMTQMEDGFHGRMPDQLDEEGRLKACKSPDGVHIIVAGNIVGFHHMVIETHSFSGSLEGWRSVKIEKP